MTVSNTADQRLYDVCVIGSGPAGIIFALEFTRLNPQKHLLMIEYGGQKLLDRNQLDQTIEVKNLINHHPPHETTNKGLGGTSATWGGRCVMYDEVDFLDRPVVAGNCTWDSALLDEIRPYGAQAASYFECGQPVFNVNDLPTFRDHRIAEHFREGPVTDSCVERWSMPTRFGDRYGEELTKRPNLTLMTGYEARQFAKPDSRRLIESLVIRRIADQALVTVNARRFVIAAGAQESTRLLLRNTQVFDALGAVPDALGKYYQGHVSGKIASVRFSGDPSKTDYGFMRDSDGSYVRRRFQFATDYLVEQNLLNTAIWLDNPLYFDPKHRSGPMSLMYLAMITPVLGKKLAPPAIGHSITKGKVTGIRRHAWNILRGLPGSLSVPLSIFYRRYWLKRKLPGVFLFSPENQYALHFHAEQIPDHTNRMELGPDGETLVIQYDLTDDDVNSVIRLHHTLDQWLQRCHCGKLAYWYTPAELPDAIRGMSKDGIHQVGTTRIADSAANGVVDRNLTVWGTSNLFVCSSSVFPTSGQANPTFLLGAFAARLANALTSSDANS